MLRKLDKEQKTWAALAGVGLVSAYGLWSVLRPARVWRLTSGAERELRRWRGLSENTARGAEYIRRYWQEGVGQAFPGVSVPWSAAFIVYVANRANRGSLPRSGSHMLYAGMAKAGQGDFRVMPPKGVRVRPGDLLLTSRAGSTLSYSSIGQGHAESHVDIVTRVVPGYARAIGGNKNNTVAVENYALKTDGTLADPRVFAILRLS